MTAASPAFVRGLCHAPCITPRRCPRPNLPIVTLQELKEIYLSSHNRGNSRTADYVRTAFIDVWTRITWTGVFTEGSGRCRPPWPDHIFTVQIALFSAPVQNMKFNAAIHKTLQLLGTSFLRLPTGALIATGVFSSPDPGLKR